MRISNLFTGFLGAAAALQGARAAPMERDGSVAFQLDSIRNGDSPLPEHLLDALETRYTACLDSGIFNEQTADGEQLLCFADGSINAAFWGTLQGRMPSDIPTQRESLHRMYRSRAVNPLGSPVTAGHSLDDLRRISFNDYKDQQPRAHAHAVDSLVDVLRSHVPAEERSSLAQARVAARSDPCRKALKVTMRGLLRAEIALRLSLVTWREISDPESISREQADALRADLAAMRFGNSPLKQRMRRDALVALVDREPRAATSTDQRSVATE